MSRLIVVSNRVADPSQPSQSGGLAVGVLDALRQRGGLWFGWDGNVTKPEEPVAFTTVEHDNITIATVSLSEADYQDYYNGFCNSILWPVFHNRLDVAAFEASTVESYRRVNQDFATRLAPIARPDDLVWVHDYHLIPLGRELRRAGCESRLGFFLHIPFPSPDVVAAIPEHEWLLQCLLDYDVIGFQTAADLDNFKRSLHASFVNCSIEGDHVSAAGHLTVVINVQIGIDVDAFAAMASTEEAERRINQLNRRELARVHIIGVDRLDYTKGLPARLRAFQRLLELYPSNMKAVTLMQVAPPTREDVDAYGDIKAELEGLSGAINGAFGDFDWTPVRYIRRSIARDTLAALFRGSHIGLVTPLRDGMNLVAKEYVAAQDHNDPGVLVLSRFAGAAEDLEEALIVNPYDADEVAHALQQAIRMPLPQRRERHQALLERIRRHDARNWRETFLTRLAQAG